MRGQSESIYFGAELFKKLKELAEKENKTVSQIVREIVRKELEK